MESKNITLIETKSRKVLNEGLRDGENGEMLTKGYKLSVIKLVSSWNLMFSMLTVVNRIVFYI